VLLLPPALSLTLLSSWLFSCSPRRSFRIWVFGLCLGPSAPAFMIFVKVAKCTSLSVATVPLGLCALAVGYLFGAFLQALSYCPDLEDGMFTYTMLGFALIETFMVLVLGTMGLILSL
jgi:F0F1-type ATP synthase membrane subunit c/vacuolar-type H+-ATPase subunit K